MDKESIRAKYKQLRDNINSMDDDYYDNCAHVASHYILLLCSGFRSIAGYFPVNYELNILPALHDLFLHGTIISLLKRDGDSLFFSRWNLAKEELVLAGEFYQPKLSDAVVPDIILTPCIAFDKYGSRVGYGQGYYDMALSKYPEARKVITAYSMQEVDYIETEAHDIPCDIIITEKGIKQLFPMS